MNYSNVLGLSLTTFLPGLVFALKEILKCDCHTVEYVSTAKLKYRARNLITRGYNLLLIK